MVWISLYAGWSKSSLKRKVSMRTAFPIDRMLGMDRWLFLVEWLNLLTFFNWIHITIVSARYLMTRKAWLRCYWWGSLNFLAACLLFNLDLKIAKGERWSLQTPFPMDRELGIDICLSAADWLHLLTFSMKFTKPLYLHCDKRHEKLVCNSLDWYT